jgi:hypothetical protein
MLLAVCDIRSLDRAKKDLREWEEFRSCVRDAVKWPIKADSVKPDPLAQIR